MGTGLGLLDEVAAPGADLGAGEADAGRGGEAHANLPELAGGALRCTVNELVAAADPFDEAGEDFIDTVGPQGVTAGFLGDVKDVSGRPRRATDS